MTKEEKQIKRFNLFERFKGLNKEDRLEFIRTRYNELKQKEIVYGGGVIHSSSIDLNDELDKMNTFKAECKEKKSLRNVINNDD
jgi:hypothetical protein